jgi:hypothetical protein
MASNPVSADGSLGTVALSAMAVDLSHHLERLREMFEKDDSGSHAELEVGLLAIGNWKPAIEEEETIAGQWVEWLGSNVCCFLPSLMSLTAISGYAVSIIH